MELASQQSTAAKLYTAKTVLAQAENARASLHAVWHGHIAECVERWTAYQKEFVEQDQALKEQVEAAQEALKVAQAAWTESKDGTMEISDTEETSTTSPLKAEAGAILQEGIANMVKGLTEIKGQTEALCPEQPPAKRVRSTEPSKLGSGAMQPFAKPGA